MQEHIRFWLDKPGKEEEKYLSTLNTLLKPSGASATIKKKVLSNIQETIYFLDVQYDYEEYIVKSSRNAGRKKTYLDCKVDEIKDRIKEEGVDQVAHNLGVSRATLYRRLKEAKENDYDGIF